MSDAAAWRQATADDLDAIVSIQDRVHTLESETRDVFAEKLRVFPQGCCVFGRQRELLGYGVYHPWRLGHVPALNAHSLVMPGQVDCLFVHDVALLPSARGHGAARTLIGVVRETARMLRLHRLALVSVYDTVPLWTRLGFAVGPVTFDAEKRGQYGDTARYMVAELDRP